jgi:DNA processing protein
VDAALVQADAELAEWEREGLDFIPILSERYPSQLASVFDAPPFLFARGTVVPGDRGMSVVGSRRTTAAGEAMAQDAARVLAERGLSVIAGLAAGIDTIAHATALEVGARTVAVIGTGINRCYPAANRGLQEEIAARGLVLSQFYPDAPPNKNTFPKRNGTMSGYGIATIVIEAGEHSGTRIQARKAAEHGRPVILTQLVASTTQWGAEIARNPWVRVVGSRRDLEQAVDEIASDPSALLLRDLGLVS